MFYVGLCSRFVFQMDLKLRFVEADVCDVIKESEMQVGRKYPITRARRMVTKYGESVLLTILGDDGNSVRVFLPKRYTAVLTDDDIDMINSKRVALSIIYNGTCEKTKACKLEIDTE